jgi:hypothetical protein
VTQAARFRELLRHDGMIVAPGAYDCIIARMIGRARFECVAKAPTPKGFAVFGKRLLQCHSAYFSTSDQTPFHSADGAVTRN